MSDLSAELQDFIRSCIKSVWALDALLLLHRRRDRAFTAAELERELRGSPQLVAGLLPALRQAGAVWEHDDGRLQYAPNSPQLDRLIGQLEDAYARTPVAVVKEILAAPNHKIQTFADAFRIKKD